MARPTPTAAPQPGPPPPPPPEVVRREAFGPPAPTAWERHGPVPRYPVRPAVLVAVLVAAVVGWVTLVLDRPGLDWLLCGVALAGVAVVAKLSAAPVAVDPVGTGRHAPAPRPVRERLVSAFWAASSLALLGVTALRANGWLAAYCLVGALATGSIALSGGRTARGLSAGAGMALIAPVTGLPWLARGARRLAEGRKPTGGTRVGMTLLLTVLVLVVFGALLTSADAAFATVLGHLEPQTGVGRPAAFGTLLVIGAGVAALAGRSPGLDALAGGPDQQARRWEWAVPLAALDALFGAFVLVQIAVLFGGRAQVLRDNGPTYANYARSGFWQLVVVTLLTLVVIGVALRVAPRTTVVDQWLLRVLLGGLSVLTLVIVASAVKRLALYEQAYGYTRLRVLVGAVELWLGLLFVLVIVALVTLRTRWLPRVVLATAVLALLSVGLADPDRFVAAQNVERYRQTGQIDTGYLSQLSPDALPELLCLPPTVRNAVVDSVAEPLRRTPDTWRTWNLGRDRARRLLAGPPPDCG